MTRPWDVVVVGGGPAGLLAAGRAAQLGARVLLLEQMEKPARKMRISGKGRGNLTNAKPLEAHLAEVRTDPRFLRPAFGAFFNEDLMGLVEGLGVPLKTERGGRVFPASDRAWDLAEALVAWARAQGAELQVRSRVLRILDAGGSVAGVEVARGAASAPHRIPARTCILATGGQSYPATGSTGDGFRFAAELGHSLKPPRPSLVALATRPLPGRAQGLRLRNVRVALHVEGEEVAAEFGEAEFTARGLGGPALLRLSRQAVDALREGRRAALSLDLKPALDPAKLAARLARELAARRGTCRDLLRALLPPPLVEVIGGRLHLDLAQPAARFDGPLRQHLPALLKDLRFEVTGHGDWAEAIVTAGGVCLDEVDPCTLASRKVAGLFLAGEVLDLDANTGGFNLQIACSTGWLAGQSAARRALGETQAAPESARP